MSTCKGCGALIRWVKTTTGQNAPMERDDAGLWVIRSAGRDDSGYERFVAQHVGSVAVSPGEQRYTNHFATCPRASEFRRVEG